MNFQLPFVPTRTKKTRSEGVNMIMDKGLSLNEATNLIDAAADYIDYVKLGFGTSMFANNLESKIKLYKDANIKVYLGGTLFEAFVIRNMFNEYINLMDKYNINTVEVSDGSIKMEHKQKCKYISQLATQREVLSEVGSKEAGVLISPDKWVEMMQAELEAGAVKVIAEARESGNVGIYKSDGSADNDLINQISAKVSTNSIIWETPLKSQQVWFVKLFGSNVNLGNIAPNDVISLETIRVGLRGDTFFTFLPDDLKSKQI